MLAQIQSHALLFFRPPKPHQSLKNREDDQGADKGKYPGPRHSDQLHPELTRVAEEKAVVSGCVDSLGGEKSGRQSPPGPAHSMDSHHIEGIIITQLGLQVTSNGAEDPSPNADKNGRHGPDKTRCWRDRHEPGYSSAGSSEDRGLTSEKPVHRHPGEYGGRGRRIRHHERTGSQAIGGQRAARVKAKPPYPQKRGPDNAEGKVMRRHRFLSIANPLAEHKGGG